MDRDEVRQRHLLLVFGFGFGSVMEDKRRSLYLGMCLVWDRYWVWVWAWDWD